jgi:hypothetical protein
VNSAHAELLDRRSSERFTLQAGSVSLATSKLYTGEVLPPAIAGGLAALGRTVRRRLLW